MKCERSTDAPPGFIRVSAKDGGGVFKPDEPDAWLPDPIYRRKRGDKTPRRAGKKGGFGTVATVAKPTRTFRTAEEAVAAAEHRHGLHSAIWTYHDAQGEPVFLAVRFERPPDPEKPDAKSGKTFRPISRVDGGWIVGDPPGLLPLYALPDLLATPAASRVYVVEGEKSADAARAVGLVATTSPHGSKSASKADWSPIAGRDVVILPDHDDAGERYADDVTRLARAAGAKSVRIVRLVELWAGMPEGGDMADIVEYRGGDVEPLRAEVEALADGTEPETIEPETDAVQAFKPFPTDVLPEPVRSFVMEAAKSIGCDTSYVALPLFSGLTSAIGNSHRIALKRGWTEPAIVWTAIIGESGTAKSPAQELALSAIRKRQHEAMKEHAEAMNEHAELLAFYERDAAVWRKTKSETSPPAKPEAPTADRCWTDDTTTEALAVLLQHNPRGLLMVKDELAGWFNFDRYASGRGGDAAKWLEMFGGRPMVVDRKGGGTLYVPRASVSIAGGIQPGTLRRALGMEHTENGLASRLLMACPPKQCPGWSDADVSAETEAAIASIFERLYALSPETDENGDERPRLVQLADDGRAAVIAWVDWHAEQMRELSGPVGYAWAKLKGYAARLALVIHLTRWVAGDPSLRDPARADEASVAAGVVLARWFGDEARRVYAILSESDDDRDTRRLVEWIERKGGTMTVREVRALREYRPPGRAEAALTKLVQDGWGVWENERPGPSGGRPTKRFRLMLRRGDTGDGDETPHIRPAGGGFGTTTPGDPPPGDGSWVVL